MAIRSIRWRSCGTRSGTECQQTGDLMEEKDIFERVDSRRRSFLKKIVVGTAFAVPAMVSFDKNSLSVHMGNQARADGSGGGGGEG